MLKSWLKFNKTARINKSPRCFHLDSTFSVGATAIRGVAIDHVNRCLNGSFFSLIDFFVTYNDTHFPDNISG
jgi:hypothetical protein